MQWNAPGGVPGKAVALSVNACVSGSANAPTGVRSVTPAAVAVTTPPYRPAVVSRPGSSEAVTSAEPPAGTVTVAGTCRAPESCPAGPEMAAGSVRVTALEPVLVQLSRWVATSVEPCGIEPNATLAWSPTTVAATAAPTSSRPAPTW